MLLRLQEAHGFHTVEAFFSHLKTQPESGWPVAKLTERVAEAVKQTLKGKPREEISRAIRQAYKDVLFLFYLHQQVNSKLITEERYFWTRGMLMIAELKLLLREQALDRRMRWTWIRVEIEMPYPPDSEAAAAIEAAKQHHVSTWEVLEEGNELGQWMTDSFVAIGKTTLPDDAYGLISGAS